MFKYGVFCFSSLCLSLRQIIDLKRLAYIVSFAFLLSVLWDGHGVSNVYSTKSKDKKEAQTKVQVASSHAVVPLADIKLVTPFSFLFTEKKICFFEIAPIRYVSNFLDQHLKVLLVCIISPHAP